MSQIYFAGNHSSGGKCFSCFFTASHVRDILRKSYGDEGPSGLGPGAVLNVPEGKFSDVCCSMRDTPGFIKLRLR